MNAVRLFANTASTLRKFIPESRWGQSLRGTPVRSIADFNQAVEDLRSPAGHARFRQAKWANPVNWTGIESDLSRVSNANSLSGSTQNSVDQHKIANINTLLVIQIGCKGPGTLLVFKSTDNTTETYWAERWELYKYSYATAIW